MQNDARAGQDARQPASHQHRGDSGADWHAGKAAPQAADRLLACEGSGWDEARFRLTRDATALEAARSLGLSRAGIANALEGGALRAEADRGRRLRRDQQLAAGDRLAFRLAPPAAPGPASDRPVTVIYQDRFLMAVDKPAGILVHSDGTAGAASSPGSADTLTARVQSLLIAQAARDGRPPLVPQAIQRLDVETTGLCLFSLCPEFQPALDAQVAGHEMRKRYLALVRGRFPKQLTLDQPIGRDRHDARRMRVSQAGSPSVTIARRLRVQDGCSLLLVELRTGRRHQIRVHLSAAGFPIVGDTLYGGVRSERGLMLHAYSEQVVHPVTGELEKFATPWPERFGTPAKI